MAVMPADHIVALRRDSNRIALGVEGRLNYFVPSCPGWQVADLVWHLGIVQMLADGRTRCARRPAGLE